MDFVEAVSYAGRTRRQERGSLYLLRPGKMRWQYTQPAGKLFVSDGKMFHLYSPNANQVQRIHPRQAADWRAPLAFLLGRLSFHEQFGPITVRPAGGVVELVARARNDREVYTEAIFTVEPKSCEIRRIAVAGRDGAVTEFVFSGEVLNPRLQASLFQFQAPPGVEVVEGSP